MLCKAWLPSAEKMWTLGMEEDQGIRRYKPMGWTLYFMEVQIPEFANQNFPNAGDHEYENSTASQNMP
jgi:hypothetical protein